MSNQPSRLPLRAINEAIDAAVNNLASAAGLSKLNARVTLAQLNETFDLFGVFAPAEDPATQRAVPAQEAVPEPVKAEAPPKPPTAPRAPRVGGGRGELTSAILAALPNRAKEIADLIGKPVTSVNSTLSRLAEKGTVARTGSRGDYVYHLVTSTPDVESPTPAPEASEPLEDLGTVTGDGSGQAAEPIETAVQPQVSPEATIDDLFTDSTPEPEPSEAKDDDAQETTEDTLDDLTVPDLLEVGDES